MGRSPYCVKPRSISRNEALMRSSVMFIIQSYHELYCMRALMGRAMVLMYLKKSVRMTLWSVAERVAPVTLGHVRNWPLALTRCSLRSSVLSDLPL